jgi:hypothetical protein
MKQRLFPLALLASSTAFASSCSSSDIIERRSAMHFEVAFQDGFDAGGRDRRKDIALDLGAPVEIPVTVRALKASGGTDTGFNSYVRFNIKPGSVVSVVGDNAEGRNLKLVNGEGTAVVSVIGAFGDSRVVAEDLGYEPVSPTADPAPACSDGKDNDGDGLIDFPADTGCEFANDNTEKGGTYAAGASPPVYFKLPRIADVGGASTGGSTTPFKSQQVAIDTGFDEATETQNFDTIVTRISGSGFYATDIADNRGYSSLFAFNFNAPPGMRVCDRLRALSGTATEFYGSIQLSYPTWTVEPWDPAKRECGVPEPTILTVANFSDVGALLRLVHGMVKVQSGTFTINNVQHTFAVRVTKHFGKDKPKVDPNNPNAYFMGDEASNCDFDNNGAVDFSKPDEKACSDSCTADKECTEYSNFIAQQNFRLVVEDTYEDIEGNKVTDVGNIQADASSSPEAKPLLQRGKPVGAFVGVLAYFSGGSQFTIEARCADDIGFDPAKPLKKISEACVTARTPEQLEETQ